MNIRDIIIRKRNGKKLTASEIDFFVGGYAKGLIPDYQASAFLMSVYFQGMNEEETFFLTRAMMRSGEIYDLKPFGKKCIDKHSTGGVGDKVSLICGPVVASLGIKVPMMCGRGLGHTGGTVDKLESIPGFRTDLEEQEFLRILGKTGLVFSSQTERIAPADKKIYSLRDVTGTVENISLITSSIMSKKLAVGASGIVFDVKTGNGAFIKKKKEAELLARWLIKTARRFGRRAVALMTDMDEPLGCTVGNNLEVIESIEALRGNAAKDLLEISTGVSAAMIRLAGLTKRFSRAKKMAADQIKNGRALAKLAEVVRAQGGDPEVISEDFTGWKKSKFTRDIKAEKTGFVQSIKAREIGRLSCLLGAGRLQLDEMIDPSAGIVLFCKKGDRVCRGDIIARVYTDRMNLRPVLESLGKTVVIRSKKVKRSKKILKYFK